MDWLRQTYGASLSPDGTAVAHIVDDGGYPRAVQRFLHGWHASSSRDVELPVVGPVKRVIHSPDGHWLACEVAPDGGNRDQIWVVTTNPEDRESWRIDRVTDGTTDLIGWDGHFVSATITREDGIGESCLIDPATGETQLLDRRTNGYLVDSWAGCALIRVGPRGYRELSMLRGGTEVGLLPSDPGSVTDLGFILDDHHDRRIQHGETAQMYQPARMHGFGSGEGYVRALVRSDNGCEFARLLEVTVTPDGVSYHVIAERPDSDLDEFAVSDDLSTLALLWNIKGCSELQIISLADEASVGTVALPGLVARELSISAGGSMVAVSVEGPGLPRTVELFDTHARQWRPMERPINHRAVGAVPRLVSFAAQDQTQLHAWMYEAPNPQGAMIFLHGGPEYQERPSYNELYPALPCAKPASPYSHPTSGARVDSGRPSYMPTIGTSASAPSRTSPIACVSSSIAATTQIGSRAPDGPTVAISRWHR